MDADTSNARAILAEIGIGDFNATSVIPTMMMGPAQTDPGMAAVKQMTRGLQQTMQRMGATWIIASGRIDQNTAYCLHALAGPTWNERPWFDLINRIVAARNDGKRFAQTYGAVAGKPPVSLEGILPDVPNLPFLVLGGYLAYRYFFKKHSR